ncbi:phage holin family protein [Alistipes putredinis]|uniref:phage holin family protein n=1 Tax=Alistipes putredinis TaxID=28117 RepID=UPI003F7BF784
MTESQSWSIVLACIMMMADVVVGFVGAAIRHDISSTKMREGIGHKVMMVALIFVAYVLGVGLTHVSGIQFEVPSTEVVCWYTIVMEVASIIENMAMAWPAFSDSKLFRYFSGFIGGEDNAGQ